MIDTVLIANRGEIALRIARTCREMGIRTVAVCSTADMDSAVARLADEVVCIGPPAAKKSYLSIPAIIEAAKRSGAQAIHPGYGFLSENPDFAEVCEEEGLRFIGPPPQIMARLGDKAQARAMMSAAGLPVLPGGDHPPDDAAEAKAAADAVGYPVILKAVAGGGGRGMRVVRDPRDLVRAFHETRASARAVFGDGRLYLERYIESARHVEVQVLLDSQGNGIHLGERDCSVQRRHQKLIEETPAPGLDPSLTTHMCEVAVKAAAAVGFTGAGTFEFLVEGSDFYFMEVNCRIQVEHPVTEAVTGLDLIREQIRVASGLPLELTQDGVVPVGHAIECRVNTEDPERGFVPTAGTLTDFRPPGGPFTRVDTHGYAGMTITPDYDSLLAKVITWGGDRQTAIARMDRALSEFVVEGRGIGTTIGLLREVLRAPDFLAARHDTMLLTRMLGAP
ncbi:acetyl/propionyl/methylcrotonyl-CoA carboxylase subunit alpha [Nonomuraea sp. NPDC050556]|uniref:acetyl/propionyl/methylcrotonyl-CoA carboxylase subunit alpha n=1 Tax=Nonomuraea sp. NPDC050556 TaxID=3364369 RepID=UPI0037AD7280